MSSVDLAPMQKLKELLDVAQRDTGEMLTKLQSFEGYSQSVILSDIINVTFYCIPGRLKDIDASMMPIHQVPLHVYLCIL